MITDQFGQVKARRDFMPFGEELYTGVGGRSASLNYGTSQDDIRQKFTGYQKDNETGLDFAEARMYENRFGRFTAVDPLLASGKSANPQTFNRYIYTSNNPIIRVDRDGREWHYVSRTIQEGDRSRTIFTPIWIGRPLPEGTVPQGEPNYEGKWNTVMPFVYQIGVGESAGKWAALDPNSNQTGVFESQAFAEIQYNVYVGKLSDWEATLARFDVLTTRMVQDSGDSSNLVRSVANHPQAVALDRVTNPDGVQVGWNAPFGMGGGSVWATRDFDYGYSTSPAGVTPTDIIQGLRNQDFEPMSFRNLLGGVNASATYIAGQRRDDRDGRVSFFVGRAVNASACYFGACLGATRTDPSETQGARFSFNPGVGSPSANVNMSTGVCAGNIWGRGTCPR